MAPNLLKSFPVSHFYRRKTNPQKKVNSPNKLTRQIFPLKTHPNFHPTPGGWTVHSPSTAWRLGRLHESGVHQLLKGQEFPAAVFGVSVGGKHLGVFHGSDGAMFLFFLQQKIGSFLGGFSILGCLFFEVYHGWWFLPAKQVGFHCNARLLESRIYNSPDIVWDDLRQLIWL